MTTWWSNQAYRPSFHIVVGVDVRHSYAGRAVACTGVRVNSVAPGWVKTAMSQSFWEDPLIAAGAIQSIPARRFADPADIANVVLFLVSGLAGCINGHCLVADGGRIAGVPA